MLFLCVWLHLARPNQIFLTPSMFSAVEIVRIPTAQPPYRSSRRTLSSRRICCCLSPSQSLLSVYSYLYPLFFLVLPALDFRFPTQLSVCPTIFRPVRPSGHLYARPSIRLMSCSSLSLSSCFPKSSVYVYYEKPKVVV